MLIIWTEVVLNIGRPINITVFCMHFYRIQISIKVTKTIPSMVNITKETHPQPMIDHDLLIRRCLRGILRVGSELSILNSFIKQYVQCDLHKTKQLYLVPCLLDNTMLVMEVRHVFLQYFGLWRSMFLEYSQNLFFLACITNLTALIHSERVYMSFFSPVLLIV